MIIPPPTDKTLNPDDNAVASYNRIAITLNIGISINGKKYDLQGNQDASGTTNICGQDDNEGGDGDDSDRLNIKAVRIYTKAAPNFSLTIRDGRVVLTRSNFSDKYQYWYKYENYSTSVKDTEGNSSFVMVNKATGQAIKHSIGHDNDVQLVTFNRNRIDKSVLWTCKVMEDSFTTIRNIDDVSLLFDAWNGDGEGVREGTKIIQWKFVTGHNQLWKIVPY